MRARQFRSPGCVSAGIRRFSFLLWVWLGSLVAGDLRIECDLGWFQADASAAAVTGDAIFSVVWLGILLGCWGGGGCKVSCWRWGRGFEVDEEYSPNPAHSLRLPVYSSGVYLAGCVLWEAQGFRRWWPSIPRKDGVWPLGRRKGGERRWGKQMLKW